MLNIDQVIDNLTGYIEARVDIIKLDVKDQSTRIGVATLVWCMVGFFGLMALLFLSIAGALVLGFALGSLPLGFVLVAVVYLTIGAVLVASKEKLLKLVERRVFPDYTQPTADTPAPASPSNS